MRPAVPVWRLLSPAPAEALRGFPVPPLAARILWNRGLREPEEAEAFLSPDYHQLADPFAMKGMEEATRRISRALAAGEPIVVFGDFDADGVTGVALLVQSLRRMGGRVEAYIPHRIEEGYGLNRDAVERLAAAGTRVLITVDCGISNAEEVARAQALGLDVIVTDHHHPPPVLPAAHAVLNPSQPGCGYPFKELAGVGIAFTLVRGLVKAGVARNGMRARELLDLVVLGTVADVSPLVGENRVLVALGLEVLRRTERPGLRALMAASGVRQERVNTGTISFVLGPRLNAAGRLKHAVLAYRLLLSENLQEAESLAAELDALNRERQEMTNRALERARERVLALPDDTPLIFLADRDFPAAIAGLVAAKIVEEFYRPTLLAEVNEEVSRGSARSIPAFHITEALQECADLLERFGGHRVAAGFTLPTAHLEALAARLQALARERLDDAAFTPVLALEAEASLGELNWDLLRVLERIGPYGVHNPHPVFLCPRVKVVRARRVGTEGEHLRLTLSDGRLACDAIGFRLGSRIEECTPGRYLDLACTLGASSWTGEERLELQLRDFRPARA